MDWLKEIAVFVCPIIATPNAVRPRAGDKADLERCNREIERLYRESETEPDTAGVLMGLRDWQYEKRLIEAELRSTP